MGGLMTASAVTACVKSAQGSSVSWQHPTALLFCAAPRDESHHCPDVFSCHCGPHGSLFHSGAVRLSSQLHASSLSSLHLLPACVPPLLLHLSPVTSLPPSQSSSGLPYPAPPCRCCLARFLSVTLSLLIFQ